MDTDAYLVTPDEAAELVPIIDPAGLRGPSSIRTKATSIRTARPMPTPVPPGSAGAEISSTTACSSLAQLPSGEWQVETERGDHHRRARRQRRPGSGRAGSVGWSASTTRSCPCSTTT